MSAVCKYMRVSSSSSQRVTENKEGHTETPKSLITSITDAGTDLKRQYPFFPSCYSDYLSKQTLKKTERFPSI